MHISYWLRYHSVFNLSTKNLNMNYPSSGEIESYFYKQSKYAPIAKKSSAQLRITKLNDILKWIEDPENSKKIIDAIYQDMQRPSAEIIGSEIATIILCIRIFKKNLNNWLKPKKLPTPLPLRGNKTYMHYEPKGTSLIISPWNYPFQLAVIPLIYAIAGGNTAIIKPSEYSTNTSMVLKKMVSDLFKEEEVKVIQGAVEETQTLLSLPFNHIYFTGSPEVGKIVMSTAAKNLTSVTLELGGKSPCIVDDTISINDAARSIIWGKNYNAGQTCIAPDYILVQNNIMGKFIDKCSEVLSKTYGNTKEEILKNPDLGRIISDRHWQRSKSLLDNALSHNAKILFGGFYEEKSRFISPTLLTNTSAEMKIRTEEIFCPILPIIPYESLNQAMSMINELPKPLTMYIFSKSKKNTDYIIENSSAGTTLINDTLIHFANEFMPFGGVNNSGIGKSHGQNGLLEFMNERSVMKQIFNLTSILHPPYTSRTERILKLLSKI